MPTDLQSAKDLILATLRKEATILKQAFGSVEFSSKADKSKVTELDKHIEMALFDVLSKFDDSIGFRGEEYGTLREGDVYWLVDPIDGTEHFIRGINICRNMIALVDNGKPIFGLLYNFIEDEYTWAEEGKGAYFGEERIYASNRPTDQAMISLDEDTRIDAVRAREIKYKLSMLDVWPANTGASGIDFEYFARGMIEGKISDNKWMGAHDVAPGLIIAREAGGIVREHGSDSDDLDLNTDKFVLATKSVYSDLKKADLA